MVLGFRADGRATGASASDGRTPLSEQEQSTRPTSRSNHQLDDSTGRRGLGGEKQTVGGGGSVEQGATSSLRAGSPPPVLGARRKHYGLKLRALHDPVDDGLVVVAGLPDDLEKLRGVDVVLLEEAAVAAVARVRGSPYVELLVETCCAIAAADGGFDGEERAAVIRICKVLKLDPDKFEIAEAA